MVVLWRHVKGGEDVLMCLRSRSEGVAIRRYRNHVQHYPPRVEDDQHLQDKQWELVGDERLSCRFSRIEKVHREDFDLGNSWYQLYAWGEVSQCQSLITYFYLNNLPYRYSKKSRFSSLCDMADTRLFTEILHYRRHGCPDNPPGHNPF